MSIRNFAAAGALTLAMVTPAFAATAALAAPPSNGCPAGYDLLSVQELTSKGYLVPAQVDSPTSGLETFGRPGNGDGWICGVKLGNQLTPFGEPKYNFVDNQLPASS